MAAWHPDPYSIYVNRSSLTNFALGFDRYQEINGFGYGDEVLADCLSLNFLFFNVTITRWRSGSVWKTSRRY